MRSKVKYCPHGRDGRHRRTCQFCHPQGALHSAGPVQTDAEIDMYTALAAERYQL